MKKILTILMLCLSALLMQAQITIGGNIYGGGNAGNTGGSTSVTIHAGDLNMVFGGARMADVGGSAFVNIDGEHASDNIIITSVYGGNDIAGTIGKSSTLPVDENDQPILTQTGANGIDANWNAFVRTSPTPETVNPGDRFSLVIGSLYGGGNGDYTYTVNAEETSKYDITIDGTTYTKVNKPELGKTYLEILGGCIAHLYGGGNNATVTGNTTIYIDNDSPVLTETNVMPTAPAALTVSEGEEGYEAALAAYNAALATYRAKLSALAIRMELSTTQSDLSSYAFNFARVFGGNNKADMAIRPTWNLQKGVIRDLYSGGNEGRMTSPEGLLLQIPEESTLIVNNVYGGCRKADVRPIWPSGTYAGQDVANGSIQLNPNLYGIPAGFSARTRILGGHIKNVYGGNDISGNVYGGSSVGILTTIYGNVYGGGNGSYAYTDNVDLKDDLLWKDFYYDPSAYKGRTPGGAFTQAESVEALNALRPNSEQVSILVKGQDNNHRVFVEGALYIGGNSASVREITDTEDLTDGKRKVELKIGSYVTIDKLFLGNNGENMIDASPEGVLAKYAGTVKNTAGVDKDLSSLDLTDEGIFAKYMDGCAMYEKPSVVFEGDRVGDLVQYVPYTSWFGSFYCGGNVGSMIYAGKDVIDFNHEIIIYDKFVGGCNNANVPEQSTTVNGVADTPVNAAYSGGILGMASELTNGLFLDTDGTTIKDRLELNLSGLKIRPMRWKKDGVDPTKKYMDPVTQQPVLEWNTIKNNAGVIEEISSGTGTGAANENDQKRRFQGGNVYGGCYSSGHVNGNVVININSTIHEKDELFDEVVSETEEGEATDRLYDIKNAYQITTRRSGVALHTQGMDPLGQALNIFGGGKGADTEIWGSATIKLNDGFTFQIFGGSEEGFIGVKENIAYKTEGGKQVVDVENSTYDSRYSTYVYLKDVNKAGSATPSDDLAEAVFIYGGGFQGPIVGDTHVYLDNGRLFNSFTGSCDADILGHTETYVGVNGFPYVIDHIYGANDLGGTVFDVAEADFTSKVDNSKLPLVYKHADIGDGAVNVLKASSYVEYQKGHVDWLFGGCYGDYDYATEYTTKTPPYQKSTFVYFRPVATNNPLNGVTRIFGASQGHKCVEHDYSGQKDKMQDRSYVLVDIPNGVSTSTFENMGVFGAGANCGVGMKEYVDPNSAETALDDVSAVIDLIHGTIGNAYGGSFAQGFTRRTVLNVPAGSDVNVHNLFGGAFGENPLKPCDVYEAHVNYHSEDAIVRNNIYGGNNNADRTLYGFVNISVPVYNGSVNPDKPTERYLSKVFGAGYGINTWSQYTEVNLESGAKVYEVYGGGENGKVINRESLLKWQANAYSEYDANDPEKGYLDLTMDLYEENGLANPLVRTAEKDVRATKTYKYNTNVIINEGAEVGNYAYGGGLGQSSLMGSGDVMGTTYIALLGGKVKKDLYAAGTSGAVIDYHGVKNGFDNELEADGKTPLDSPVHVDGFIASATAYVKGGTARNVYGGGWEGAVGLHAGVPKTRIVDGKEKVYIDYFETTSTVDDIAGETHVVIGDLDGTSFTNGIPAIERNAYGGGEGGPVFGTTNITLNRGYVGYRYFANAEDLDKDPEDNTKTIDYIADGGGYYQEKIHDETESKGRLNTLYDSGCIFGGGYVDNSNVDITNVVMYGGHVRNALFGGGEIAAIGRGIINASGEYNSVRELQGIYKAGKTNVTLYEGYVHRNVFGGGRGYNNLGEGGTLYSDGYVFGQTEVCVYGGEIGTEAGLELGYGNVFGGGDIGYVYSAYEDGGKLCVGIKNGNRYDDNKEGYYYKYHVGTDSYGAYTPGPTPTLDDPNWVKDEEEFVLTEDSKVLIEPHCKVNDIKILKDIKQTVEDVEVVLYAAGKSVSQEQFDAIPAAIRTTLTEGVDWEKITSVTINHTYYPGDYVLTTDLHYLKNKAADAAKWSCLDDFGIIIHNAVFAGGNTSSGSASVYANATTVFGNATASIHDVYHRDLITLGTGHTGGLYGDGNLTFVDGYRGLNITNYGTDYYSIDKEITIEQYRQLPSREAAYYELKYKCIQECTDDEGTTYSPADPSNPNSKASTLTADDILTLFKKGTNTSGMIVDGKPNSDYWSENGVLPVYAGRLMNTIQRADFCGVFGSRMVMQGAQDRVPEIVDYTNYTINRVREVSLNQQHSIISSDLTPYTGSNDDERLLNEGYADVKKAIHGNYFGIYNIVNYLGGLTSDQHFKDVRITENTSNTTYKDPFTIGPTTYNYGAGDITSASDANASYYNWKIAHLADRKRNNGRSQNKVALASGVYLELTTEQSTGDGLYEKDWGYITGVIELDLINVQTGIGGGFVYAKNEHRTWEYNKKKHTTLTALNTDAVTRKDYDYSNELVEWETSGNFVHSNQTIIDDCYNISGKYKGTDAVPAHYWYIKGSVYVYDQYISAYTGAPNAYSEKVDIPLTITAASHGTMKLLDVKTNRNAYFKANGQPMDADGKIVINDVTYYKNDPISYWDYYLMSSAEKALFEADTYVVIADCKIGNTEYKEGTVMTKSNYLSLRGETPPTVTYTVTNPTTGEETVMSDKSFDYFFRSSNNLGHDTGYILTYKVNNPTNWDTWYTQVDPSAAGEDRIKYSDYNKEEGYEDGPTYRLIGDTGELLGQRKYTLSNIISEDVYLTYQAAKTAHPTAIPTNDPEDIGYDPEMVQAEFERAWIVTDAIELTGETLVNGRTLPASQVLATSSPETLKDTYEGKVEKAYVCTHTIQIAPTEYIYLGAKMTEDEKNAYMARFAPTIEGNPNPNANADLVSDINDLVVPAYYCTKEGLYGGNYYEAGKNYRGLEAWSSMSPDDRAKFAFNYDALDLLIDPNYSGNQGQKWQYDGNGFTTEDQAKTNPGQYSVIQPVDYTASYNSDSNLSLTSNITVKRMVDVAGTPTLTNVSTNSIQKDDELDRETFEALANEKRYYSVVTVTDAGNYYVVKAPFQVGSTPYAVGSTISSETYNGLSSDNQANIMMLTFSEEQKNQLYYFCRESYQVAADGTSVTGLDVRDNENDQPALTQSYSSSTDPVPIGLVIGEGTYSGLQNDQQHFIIHGIAPTETSTLYVSRNSDIFDLSTEKIITVIYQYDYEEGDGSGNITPVSERHVVNIHIKFKSGVPTVEDIRKPQIILPGTKLGMREPNVTPGAYEITGGGWEIFQKVGDAESHINGIEYVPLQDKLYWYQNEYWVAYYALTYLGKTYSNHVQLSVANYHDLAEVMGDKEHHYFIDHRDVDRKPKIYINDYSGSGQNGLDHFKNLIDLSYVNKTYDGEGNPIAISDASSPLDGHVPLDNSHEGKKMRGGDYLEFFLRSDQNHNMTKPNPDYDPDDPGSEATLPNPWTPIANGDGQCFSGIFHGDGYTISGLDKSLFNHLCGDVYNLGVTGTFTSAGVAETGEGYMENCWIYTTNDSEDKTSAPVFGSPTITPGDESAGPYRIVNCYYLEDEDVAHPYTNHSGSYGIPVKKSEQAFYNGEVTYDLNGFYLNKRFYDSGTSAASTALGASPTAYSYYRTNADGSIPTNAETGEYTVSTAHYPATVPPQYGDLGYVESRFQDGDFIYAGGSIPETSDARLHTGDEGSVYYYPIWPDDYLFFGQMLSYGHEVTRTHQPLPAHVNKSGSRLATASNSINRVYRAPAYFRSKKMGVAHYNPYAIFAAESADKSHIAYPNMTAIDFTGHNDDTWSRGSVSQGFADGSPAFYPPLLDNDGLTRFRNVDLTKNLLVYTPATTGVSADANTKTNTAVYTALTEPTYEETDATYRTVAAQDDATHIYGHPVELVNSNYIAKLDHFLVDKQDFNCPIEYSFDSSHLMWYQRKPDNYVGQKKDGEGNYDTAAGWEGVSLPFTAELVTTDQKGEITHFYGGSEESKNGTNTKIGHEYWLREFTGIASNNGTVATANFSYPDVITAGEAKTVTNTFLWDYYYYETTTPHHEDKNNDTYQTYYQMKDVDDDGNDDYVNKFDEYPRLANATPYIIGFPGERYYEFDLSGKFKPTTTSTPSHPAQLKVQTVTFASKTGIPIRVSDDELTGVTPDGSAYTFVPSYMNETLRSVRVADASTLAKSYALNADGNAYIAVTRADDAAEGVGDVAALPFRPYFTSVAGTSPAPPAHSIIFSNEYSQLKGGDEHGDPDKDGIGALTFTVGKHKIIATSTLRNATEVRISTVGGVTVSAFTIQPGETIVTPVSNAGVYIVNRKKLVVR